LIVKSTRRRYLASIAVVALLLSGCDWAHVGFGPDRRNYNPSEPALTESSVTDLGPAWSKACTCAAGALVVGGTVYVVDSATLRALDAATGASRWSTPVASGSALVAVANGLVYLTSGTQLAGRDATNGAPRFTVNDMAGVIIDGRLAYGYRSAGGGTTVSAIDTAGHVAWQSTQSGIGNGLVADPGTTVYLATDIPLTSPFATVIHLLTGLRESDGALDSVVSVDVPGGFPPLAFADGLVFSYSSFAHGSNGIGLFGVRPATGEVAWSTGRFPLAYGPGMVIATFEAEWVGLDSATGAIKWQFFDTSDIDGAGAVVGSLFLRNVNDKVIAYRLSDGTKVTTYTPAAGQRVTSLIASGGQLFATTNTQLYAIKPAA
jgi:outer membrane protein assembly factor BamB